MRSRPLPEPRTLALSWADWLPLNDRVARLRVPRGPGLYRVRRVGESTLAYVGQSSGLRGRLSQLCALYGDEMPYNDPHTAAPCLWVMRTAEGAEFEVSVAELAGDVRERKLAECVVVSEHRAEFGRSPTANFGRMPDGWIKSTGNNAALAKSGRRARGYQDPAVTRSLDYAPVLDLDHAPTAPEWAGLPWSPWRPGLIAEPTLGVYRIRSAGEQHLVYLGQGRIGARLTAHAAKSRLEDHRQRAAFTGDLESSWAALPTCTAAQLLEVECDLIASHALFAGLAPEAQFFG
ncbi:hypothetical protein Aiant_49120 [Actinoplanes ianthinogenes]|uniref:GIY-YIG domain-containing protein n=2 Tax=Actinoplanes ianthinogenes TaxID=122358 RepID=A0ABM7LY62_9ACTN|nr:hypothetical protein Aiant_49120 [Actinoplanes ianthinogenes]